MQILEMMVALHISIIPIMSTQIIIYKQISMLLIGLSKFTLAGTKMIKI